MNDSASDFVQSGLRHVVAAADRAGLVDALADEPATAECIARRCGVDPRATRLVLDALASLGLCRKSADGYRRERTFRDGWPWSKLSRFLATGEVLTPIDDRSRRGETYEAAVDHLAERFESAARFLASALRPVDTILDVGCGSGVWSLEMIRERPQARVFGLDLAPVVGRFLARARALGLADRVGTVVGDYLSDPPELTDLAFDRVVLANVLHLENEADASRLVAGLARRVGRGGELVVVDCFPGGDPGDEVARAFYSLHLGMRTGNGRVHPQVDVERWLRQSGLAATESVRIPGWAALAALVARRVDGG